MEKDQDSYKGRPIKLSSDIFNEDLKREKDIGRNITDPKRPEITLHTTLPSKTFYHILSK